MAKRVGLTRPLAFLSPRDQLIYKTLVALAENDLLQGSPAWTRLGQADPANEADDASTLGESGWFRSWLRREGHLWVIDDTYDWLVEGDVSNFFPSVQVQDVCAFVLDNSRLGVALVRLLEYMLLTFSPMAAYRPSRVGGLPQEGFDVSRVLAHLYLRPLDEQFDWEGRNGRYTRWVDDVVVGADSWDEALRVVQRIQQALEGTGLYANSSKTRVIPSAAFRDEYLKSDNDWLGEFEVALKLGGGDLNEFRRRLCRHNDRKDRPRGWSRVLRRYYTYSRRLRDAYLLDKWPNHIDETPDSARSIFDYLSAHRLTEPRFNRLLVVLERFGTVYEDIEILAHEYVTGAPCVASARLSTLVAEWAMAIVEREAEARPRIAAAACVTVGKFGDEGHLDRLAALHRGWKRDNVLRTQATVILLSAKRIDIRGVNRLLGRSQLETIESLEFLIALASGEKQAIGMALSALEPVPKHGPERFVLKPRLVFLAPLLRHVAGREWKRTAPRWKKALSSNSPGLRDHVGEAWLFDRY